MAAYTTRVEMLRAAYFEDLLALEAEYGQRYAAMAERYRAKFHPQNGDSRGLYDALAMTCMAAAWAPIEAEFEEKKNALLAAFYARCAQARRGVLC